MEQSDTTAQFVRLLTEHQNRLFGHVYSLLRTESGHGDFKALSPSFWDPSLSGRWIHLAVTFDIDSGTIIHYLNGQMLSRHVVPNTQMPSTTEIGPASIGNWAAPTLPDARFAIRNLNGAIDELAIFSAALSANEIRETHDYGKP